MLDKNSLNYSLLSKYRVELMGFAALLIMYFHTSTMFPYGDYNEYYKFLVSQLNIGVEIFLIVSGIGLYFSLSKPNFNFRQYYVKRVLNVYLILLLIAFPFALLYNVRNGGSFGSFIIDWTGVGFYTGKRYPGGNRGGWYVMFIMIMYLVYPLIYKVQKLLEKKKADLAVLIIVTVCHVLLCYYLSTRYESVYNSYEIGLTRIPIFLIGSYIGKLVYNKKNFSVGTYLTAVLGVVIFAVTTLFDIPYIVFRFDKMLLSFTACIAFAVFLKLIDSKYVQKFFAFFGVMSLELYLTHNFANGFLFPAGHCDNHLQYLIMIVCSAVVSFFVAKLRRLIIKKYDSRKAL